ncbi:hypothetical protein CLOACE_01200 [Clostridium acetireducens DSM 10703]|jgi:hypothetical protein|uniref:DUF4264 domain-containing protein n=1 Tax=Clostridium acetireducens DSM 10703 TaxID=1121290 RepID=A0A1E8F296_9CLOT|nr:DUF4264 family protein [Clostridium acetireducens]OFI07772.1 hypothetical protein CLOACE_01200 [Clostridium acetireducens DSM 10703]
MNNELEVVASKEFDSNYELYKVVDFLNKNLGDSEFIFGLSLNEENSVITIYKEI